MSSQTRGICTKARRISNATNQKILENFDLIHSSRDTDRHDNPIQNDSVSEGSTIKPRTHLLHPRQLSMSLHQLKARGPASFSQEISTSGAALQSGHSSNSAYTNNYNYPFQFVAEELQTADITVGSLDGSLSDESSPMPCPDSMNLIGPTGMVEGLQFSGFDVITIATNHIKDCGEKGFECDNKALLDTINTLKDAGIQPVGAGNNLQESRLPVIVEREWNPLCIFRHQSNQ